MNILVLASEYPYSKDRNSDRTKVVGFFAREWARQGHSVIAVVNSSAFPKAYYIIGNIIRRTVSRLFDVSAAPERLWTKRFSYTEDGVHVENLPMLKLIPHGRFTKQVVSSQISAIKRILDQEGFRPDVVTGHWVNPQIMIVPALAKAYGVKSAFVFHADYTSDICKKFRVQQYIPEIDHIGFRSRSAMETAAKYLTFRNEPFIAASGIPDDFIRKYDSEPEREQKGKTNILTAARLVRYKRIDAVIDACAAGINKGTYDLTIAGDGPLRQELTAQAAKAGNADCVHLIGQISREELQEKMRASDIFVLVSERETFGLVYMEAMLHGCIVIASRYGGVDGIIRDGVNGFLSGEGDTSELAQVLQKIMGLSRQEKEAISREAVRTARQYSESKAAEKYLNTITQQAAGNRSENLTEGVICE